MKRCWAFLLSLPLAAHTISMSHGSVRVEGNTVLYQLRMPDYELTHISNPEQALFSEVQFFSGGARGRLMQRSCEQNPGMQALVCDAVYQFPEPIDTLRVDCTLTRITVPNHIHLLRAMKGTHSDQAIFDNSVQSAELRFRPPTAFESAIQNFMAGFLRAARSAPAILFIVVLALAARSWSEYFALLVAFLAGQVISCAALPHTSFSPSVRFIEIALLLAAGYLLVEIVALPTGSGRWIVCGILGIFHGMFYALLLREGDFKPVYVLAGAFTVEVVTSGVVCFAWLRLGGPVRRLLARRAPAPAVAMTSSSPSTPPVRPGH